MDHPSIRIVALPDGTWDTEGLVYTITVEAYAKLRDGKIDVKDFKDEEVLDVKTAE